MNIKNILEKDQSKVTTAAIVSYIGEHPEEMKTLIDLFLNAHFRINQRAAWPLGVIGEKFPEIIKPYLPILVENLDRENIHDAVIRNTLRTFQYAPIEEALEGPLYEICFNYLIDLKQPVAIRVFSMTVLARIAHKFPELKNELIAVIKDQYEFGSAGYKSRAKRVLKLLQD